MEKVVIITGATGKLGSALARKFGAEGAKVVANYFTSQKKAEELTYEINKGPGQCFAYQADVRSYDEIKGMVEETVKRWRGVDLLLSSAGGNLAKLSNNKKGSASILDHLPEDWDLVIEVNLKGAFNCLRAVAPQMIKQHDGQIILFSSFQGIRPVKTQSSYATSKAGILGLMKAAALEFAEYNIRVNAVTPAGGNVGSMQKESLLGRSPSASEEFIEFLMYLCQTNNISGQTFHIGSRI